MPETDAQREAQARAEAARIQAETARIKAAISQSESAKRARADAGRKGSGVRWGKKS